MEKVIKQIMEEVIKQIMEEVIKQRNKLFNLSESEREP